MMFTLATIRLVTKLIPAKSSLRISGAVGKDTHGQLPLQDLPQAPATCLRIDLLGASNPCDYKITGIQLEPGPVATPFEHRFLSTELTLCHRYYDVVSLQRIVLPYTSNSNFYHGNVYWHQPMQSRAQYGT